MTHLMPELSEEEPITMDEVALIFGTHDREEGARILTSECGGCDIKVHMRVDAETGEEQFRLGDIEQVAEWRRQGPNLSSVQLADDDALDAILLSASGAPGYSVVKIAQAVGLSEGELHRRLRAGGANVEQIDGKLLVDKADADRLMRQGTIPSPPSGAPASLDSRVEAIAAAIGLDMETGKPATEEESKPPESSSDPDPFATTIDPAVAARADSVAKAIGLDLGQPAGSPAIGDATMQTATAKPRSRTRLGAPRRWSQR